MRQIIYYINTTSFFCGGRGLNPGPCIFYALSLSTELNSREHINTTSNTNKKIK